MAMDKAEIKRKSILGAALLVTLIAVVMVDDEEEDIIVDAVQTTQPNRTSSGKTRVEADTENYLAVDLLGQRQFNAQAGNIFKSTSWVPTRPQPTMQQQQAALARQADQAARRAAAPPPAPTAPPLEFKYIGKAIYGNETWVFLSEAGKNHVTKLGGRIDDKYRVDAINDEAVTFTYLPLNEKQRLNTNNKMAGNVR